MMFSSVNGKMAYICVALYQVKLLQSALHYIQSFTYSYTVKYNTLLLFSILLPTSELNLSSEALDSVKV